MLVMILAAAMAGPDGSDEADPGPKVAEFARSMLGRKVGEGQCSDLAAEALRHAEASSSRGGAWGEERASLRDARPGDILQFEDCVFVARRVLPNGVPVVVTYRAARHIAVVAEVRSRRGRTILTLLHQNAAFVGADAADREVVTAWTFDPAILRKGTLRAYRPLPAARER